MGRQGRGGKPLGRKPIGQLEPPAAQPGEGRPRLYICPKCRAVICEGDHMRIHLRWHDEWESEEDFEDEDLQ